MTDKNFKGGLVRRAGAMLLSVTMALGLLCTPAFASGSTEDKTEKTPELELKQHVGRDTATDGEITVAAGDTVTYTLLAKNPSKNDIKNVTVKMAVPEDMTYVDRSSANGSLSADGKSVVFSIESVKAGAEASVSYEAKVGKPASGKTWALTAEMQYDGLNAPVKSNEVKSKLGEAANQPSNDQTVTVKLTQGSGNIDSETSVSDLTSVKNDDKVVYKLLVENKGGAPVSDVKIVLTLPECVSTSGVTLSGSADISGNKITWTEKTLKAGGKMEYSMSSKIAGVKAETNYTAVAEITYKSAAGANETRKSEVLKMTSGKSVAGTNPGDAAGVLNLELTQAKSKTESGVKTDLTGLKKDDVVFYRLKLTNPTTAELTDLEIALNLPDGVSKKGVEMSDDSTLDGSKITWKLAKLEAGKSVEYFFSTKVDTLANGAVGKATGAVSYKANSETKRVVSNELTIRAEGGQNNDVNEGVASGDISHYVNVETTKSQILDMTTTGQFVSTVILKKLEAEKEYVLTGTVYDINTGKAIQKDGKDVTSEITFKAEGETATKEVKFTLDATAHAGKTLGVNYVLKSGGAQIGTLVNDKSARAIVYIPDITVKFTDNTGVNSTVGLNTATKLKATVNYTNLQPNKEYQILLTLVDMTNKADLKLNGKAVEAGAKFTPTSTNGTTEVEFTLDTTTLENHKLAVRAVLYDSANHKLASREDTSAEDTSLLEVKSIATAYTGIEDYAGRVALGAFILVAVAIACVFGVYRKKTSTD